MECTSVATSTCLPSIPCTLSNANTQSAYSLSTEIFVSKSKHWTTISDIYHTHTYLFLSVDTTELKCFGEISRGTYGVVYKGVWHGLLVAAKIIPIGALC